jgi:hypothetical protein
MQRRARIFFQVLATILSLAIFLCAGWAWTRSVSYADYFYRLQPTPTGGSEMKGFGSYRGALVVGSIQNSTSGCAESLYRHDTYPVMKNGSMLKAEPDTKVAALGFGVSRGQLKLTLPFSFLMPKQIYRVVYLPYYFIMLLALIQPIRLRRRLKRARRASAAPAETPASFTAEPVTS